MAKLFKIILFAVLGMTLNNVAEAKLFGAQSFVLDNGMEVVVVENHKAPIIKYMLWYKAGAVDEEAGKGGSAHLLEHLMFRGTSKISGELFDKILQQNGVESNAFTSLDYTAYHHNADISKLELVMALEADRMQNLQITDKNFALERDIVYQERKQITDNNPAAPFVESYRKLIWQENPYARAVSGSSEEIRNLSKTDVENFYQKFYAPNNAILVLSGDIDLPMAKKLANKYYGKIKSRPLGKKAEFPVAEKNISARLEMALPQISSPRLVKTYRTASYNHHPEEIYNLAVFSKYLGEGETSELYKELVINRKLALSISSSYDYFNRGEGSFQISALPAQGVSAQQLEKAIDEVVQKALAEFDEEKLAKTKKKMLAGLVYLQDNPFEAATIVGMMTAIGMPVADIESHAEKIKQVQVKDVKLSAERMLKKSGETTGILTPKGEI